MHHSPVSHLQTLLHKKSLDAVLISSLPNLIYLTNFSGFTTEDRDAFLLITQKKQFLFTHSLYKEAAAKYMKQFTLVPMTRENPISESIQKIVTTEKIKTLAYEENDLTVGEYHALLTYIDKKILTPQAFVEKLRETKTSQEIAAIQSACELGDKTFNALLDKIKPGMTEKELAVAFEYLLKKEGADTSFRTITAFGANASLPHHVPTDQKLIKDEFVLMDFGARYNNYCSDMTRTVCFGKPSREMQRVYEAVYDAQQKAIDFLEKKVAKGENVTGADVDNIAREHIVAKGFPTIPHSLGHGIGLEVHEQPSLSPSAKSALTNGMVFSIEPGIYLPGKLGVRIEDLFAIEGKKLIQLTTFPRDLVTI
jgi:Xaa-Pro aminopeptidase